MDRDRLIYLQGWAEGLVGTPHPKTAEEARLIGEMMLELVREVARLARFKLFERASSGA